MEFLFLVKKFFNDIKCDDYSKRNDNFLATNKKS
jgi:hypothetical protein